MRIGPRLRAAIEAVGVANPISPVDIDPAPLVGVLVLVNMLIGNAEDIQAQSGGPGAAGAGRRTQDKILSLIHI